MVAKLHDGGRTSFLRAPSPGGCPYPMTGGRPSRDPHREVGEGFVGVTPESQFATNGFSRLPPAKTWATASAPIGLAK